LATGDEREVEKLQGNAWIPQRTAAAALALGTALFGIGTLLHPPTVRREDLMHVVREGATSRWLADHWLLALSIALMTVGLAGFHAALAARPGVRRGVASLAAPLGAVSAVFWMALFVFEAAGWPAIAAALAQSSGPAPQLLAVAQAFWSTSLALGYAGGALFAVVVGLCSVALLRGGPGGSLNGFARLGIVTSLVGMVTQALAWLFSSLALVVLIPAAIVFGVWLGAAAWCLWHRNL